MSTFPCESLFCLILPPPAVKNTNQRCYSGALPQQLPGPAQPAWAGDDPQQAVSPGPGMLCAAEPDNDEWAESSFLRLKPPQAEHSGLSEDAATRISVVFPQSKHKKSKSGIETFSFWLKLKTDPLYSSLPVRSPCSCLLDCRYRLFRCDIRLKLC